MSSFLTYTVSIKEARKMLNYKTIIKSPSELGELWCTGVVPAYEYVNGSKTDNIIGYKYNIVAIDCDAQAFSVKIAGEKQLDEIEGHVNVQLVNANFIIYSLNGRIGVSAKADKIIKVDE